MRVLGRNRKDNRGLSLIELIVVIAIMGVLVGVLSPMFIKYVDRSRKSKDVYTAAQIAKAVNIAFVEHPEVYEAFCD
ncbi:MAG: prepilin-type N-terminal cleavage/methylation domain-containing protein [Lachnospiraceae bacterium]|nr:prepilin-type N-terminal cleavage/methylation domain-containing protein [Lachnospiraceae bacterium]